MFLPELWNLGEHGNSFWWLQAWHVGSGIVNMVPYRMCPGEHFSNPGYTHQVTIDTTNDVMDPVIATMHFNGKHLVEIIIASWE